MKNLVIIITFVCFLGNTLIAASTSTMPDSFNHQKNRQQQTELSPKQIKEGECLNESFLKESTVTIPSSFDFKCILARAIEDSGVDSTESDKLVEEILMTLPNVYHTDLNANNLAPTSFFTLSPEEQAAIFQELKIIDTTLQELIQHLPATLDGTCPIDTECPESWLNFLRYLYQKTKNPFWKKLYKTTQTWLTREQRTEWVNEAGLPAKITFYAEDAAVAFGKFTNDLYSLFKESNIACRTAGAIIAPFYIHSCELFIFPERGLGIAGPATTVGIGMLSSELIDMLVHWEYKLEEIKLEEIKFFYFVLSLGMHLSIFYRAHTWLPEFKGRNYVIATPILSEIARYCFLYNESSSGDFFATTAWRLTRALNIAWSISVIYLTSRIKPTIHLVILQQHPHQG